MAAVEGHAGTRMICAPREWQVEYDRQQVITGQVLTVAISTAQPQKNLSATG
ncbi:hypothetical protein P4233_20035 [Pseudomonas aeruginosa]|nr:hypothetical protein [Pseudomonas aeruginosa]